MASGTKPTMKMLGTRPTIIIQGARPKVKMQGARPKVKMQGTRPTVKMLGTKRAATFSNFSSHVLFWRPTQTIERALLYNIRTHNPQCRPTHKAPTEVSKNLSPLSFGGLGIPSRARGPSPRSAEKREAFNTTDSRKTNEKC